MGFDFWSDRLGIAYGGYNTAIDWQIFQVAKLIVCAHDYDGLAFIDQIAKTTGMTQEHVELIQYILASVSYDHKKSGCSPWDNEPFAYGTSPRGLFVGNVELARRFLREFQEHLDSKI